VIYTFDQHLLELGEYKVKYKLPYSDLSSLSAGERQDYLKSSEPLEFGHMLEDQIGGQIEAGFLIKGFYEDIDPVELIGEYMPTFMATFALKP
jgi:hypothetical protein